MSLYIADFTRRSSKWNRSRPRVLPVYMRTKEYAIVEQLQAGKSCGQEHCEFKSEIKLVFSVLKAPDIEHIFESVEINIKTSDLLITL